MREDAGERLAGAEEDEACMKGLCVCVGWIGLMWLELSLGIASYMYGYETKHARTREPAEDARVGELEEHAQQRVLHL